MTNVYFTNKNNTIATDGPFGLPPQRFYIEIHAASIDRDYVNNIKVTLNYPKSPEDQNTLSITQFIDLQQKTQSYTITGFIDRYSSLTAALVPYESNDAGVIKQYLEYLFDRGGLNEVVIGDGDGFSTILGITDYVERITGVITRMSIKEDSSDRVSRTTNSADYPSSIPVSGSSPNYNKTAQVKIPNKYAVTITLVEGVLP